MWNKIKITEQLEQRLPEDLHNFKMKVRGATVDAWNNLEPAFGPLVWIVV